MDRTSRASAHVLAHRSRPMGSATIGVVIVPPLGYEYWTSHRTLRTLAERLAENGCLALRFDFDGTGDSAGDQWDPARLETWQRNIGQAADALRGWGATRLVVIGLRFGGTLALTEGAAVGADAVVAWAPVARGKPLRPRAAVARSCRARDAGLPERSGVVQAGTVFSAETLAGLGAIDVRALPDPPATKVLIVDRSDKPPSDAVVDRLRALGVETDHVVRAGTELFLDHPTEYAMVPEAIVEEITGWVGPGEALEATPDAPPRRTTATIAWQGEEVEEEVVRIGRLGLVGILTRPSSGVSRGTVVWLNSGSEHHVGPGLAWVEYARTLALSGCTSLRVDFSGWGESPDLGHAPGRPYDQHGVGEVGEIVDALRDLGTRHHFGRPLCGSLDCAPCRTRRRCRGRPCSQSTALLAAWLPGGSQHRYRDPCPPAFRDPSPQATRRSRRVVIPRHDRRPSPGGEVVGRTGASPDARPGRVRRGRRRYAVHPGPHCPGLPTGPRAWTDRRHHRARHRPSDAPALAALVDGGRDFGVARHGDPAGRDGWGGRGGSLPTRRDLT